MSRASSNGWQFLVYEGTKGAGLVLCHQIFGITDYEKSVASELSKNGYWVAMPDLFRGGTPSSLEEGMRLRNMLKSDDVVGAIRNGLELLRQKTRDVKVGSMGFCMGGGFALLGAANLPLDFCVDFYGAVEDAGQVRNLSGPVILMLGSEDPRITPWAFDKFLPAAMKYKKRVDVHLYPNAAHAFHDHTGQNYNQSAARDAWAKTLSFLSQFG